MKAATLGLTLALAGCAISTLLPADASRQFDPAAFFTGRSHGEGIVHKLTSSNSRVTVDSVGRPDGRGGLILDQMIRESGEAPRQRRWVMRPAGPNRFTGTLTDAEGPVLVTVNGPRAHIRYRMKGGFDVEQQLAIQRDGRTLLNHMSVKKLGMRVARLEETIRKLD